jgi:hypothetical protein
LEIGQTLQLTAVVEPEDAPNKNLSWSSSDEAVATVSETGLVTAVAAGTAEITVTTEDGSKTDSITVTVVEGSGGPTMDILYDGTVELNPSETYTINIGSEEYTLSQNTPLGALHAASVAMILLMWLLIKNGARVEYFYWMILDPILIRKTAIAGSPM